MQDHTMQHKKKMPAFRCLVIIIDSNIRDKLTEFLTDASIPIYYQMHGVGTVSSDFLNLCGLGDTHKTIMACFADSTGSRPITMRNTLREFLKLSRQSPRSRASTDFGSLHAEIKKEHDK